MSARAGIVITGTEVLTGRVQDRNGPWLADRLLELGIELAHITICGDREADIAAQLRFLADEGVDLIVTSGGLGPTADDLTVATVAKFAGLELLLDRALEDRITDILKRLMARFDNVDIDAVRAANRKQALIPAGAHVINPIGTAPGVVVPGKPTIVVLPGPPRELQPMWPLAIETDAVQRAIAGRTTYRQDMVRMFGLPESGLAETLREAEHSIDGFDRLEITTCLRRGELEIVTRYEPDAAPIYTDLVQLLREHHGREIFSEDGSRVDDQIAQLLRGRRIATAESCTGGLLSARLTDLPGSSAYIAGAVVAYADEAKTELLDVPSELIDTHGAVSEPVAEAMADGALRRFGADTAVAITGIAGPGGGTEDKPVGTVCFTVKLADGQTTARTLRLPGDRSDIRERSTTVAMHMLRRALSGIQLAP
ncbi:competence/damage-inducible protein A [Mycobacterium sp. NPDC048908]|uniref:competence/damage-inducible protein A n=1 Tax=Mycobacterium sp. NPDC048908 TaxID=3364292 RepID=UPI003720BFFD